MTPSPTASKVSHNYSLYLVAIVSTVLLSFLALWIDDGILSPDGLLYLKAAQAFNQQGVMAAMAVYNWPFYSIAIGFIQQTSGLNYLLSSFVFNTTLMAFLFIVFLRLVAVLGAERRWQWCALFVLCAFPVLNEWRADVLRGFGYQPFALLAVLCMVRFVQLNAWRYFIFGVISFAIATLFRIEGGLLLLISPLVVFVMPNKTLWQRLRYVLYIYLVFALLLIAMVVFSEAFPQYFPLGLEKLRIYYSWSNATHLITKYISHYQLKAELFGQTVLGTQGHPDWYADSTLAAGLIYYLINVQVRELHIIFVALPLYGLIFRTMPAVNGGRAVIVGFLLANLGILLAFVFGNFFITARYALQMDLLLLLWSIFALRDIAENWFIRVPEKLSRFKNLVLIVCFTVMLGLLIDAFIPNDHSKKYLKEAGEWVKQETPANATIFTNEAVVAYYADRKVSLYNFDREDWSRHYQARWKKFDYLVLGVSVKHMDKYKPLIFDPLKGLSAEKSFRNRRGDTVWIINVSKTKLDAN